MKKNRPGCSVWLIGFIGFIIVGTIIQYIAYILLIGIILFFTWLIVFYFDKKKERRRKKEEEAIANKSIPKREKLNAGARETQLSFKRNKLQEENIKKANQSDSSTKAESELRCSYCQILNPSNVYKCPNCSASKGT